MHSAMGLWLVIFLFEHLLTNSQTALLVGEDGGGFIRMVNWIKNLPYLPAIEIFLLGVPFSIHIIWGIKYLFTAEINSTWSDGSRPSLEDYPKNHAYTWQRVTSWVLLVGVLAHVIHMRFIEYPTSASIGANHYYMTTVTRDEGIETLAARLGVELYTQDQILAKDKGLVEEPVPESPLERQAYEQEKNWIKAASKWSLKPNELVAATPNFGTAELLMVRETFKEPVMMVLYSLFVMAAVFHASNGLWTFLITWGVTLTNRSQALMAKLTTGLMLLLAFFGLASVWMTYWVNLYQ